MNTKDVEKQFDEKFPLLTKGTYKGAVACGVEVKQFLIDKLEEQAEEFKKCVPSKRIPYTPPSNHSEKQHERCPSCQFNIGMVNGFNQAKEEITNRMERL